MPSNSELNSDVDLSSDSDTADTTSLVDPETSQIERLAKVLQNAPAARRKSTRNRKGKPSATASKAAASNGGTDDAESLDVAEILQSFLESMRAHEANLKKLDVKLTKVLTTVESLQTENKNLKEVISKKDDRINKLQLRVDKLKKKDRADKVIVSCAAISNMSDANFKVEMSRLLSRKLKLAPAICKKFYYRKIGKPGKKRALIQIPDRKDRKSVFTAARTERPPDLFVNEALIESREQLYYETRQKKRETESTFSIFTISGDVYVKLRDSTSDPVRIDCIEDVDEFIANNPTPDPVTTEDRIEDEEQVEVNAD